LETVIQKPYIYFGQVALSSSLAYMFFLFSYLFVEYVAKVLDVAHT